MNRRRFTTLLLPLGGAIFLRQLPAFGNDVLPFSAAPLPDHTQRLIFLANSQAIGKMPLKEKEQLFNYFVQNTIHSDLVPYARGARLDNKDVDKFVQQKVEYRIQKSRWIADYQQEFVKKGNWISGGVGLVTYVISGSIPVVGFATAATAVMLGVAEDRIGKKQKKFADKEYAKALYESFYVKVVSNDLRDIERLPRELRSLFATTPEEAARILRQSDSLEGLPEAVKERIIENINRQPGSTGEPGNETTTADPNDPLTAVFERMGNGVSLLPTSPDPDEIAQKQKMIESFQAMGNLVISQFAAPTEQTILSAAFNAGMSYWAMTAAGAAVTPYGWAAIGIGFATELLSGFASNKSSGMEAAFKAIFKQLQQIQLSLQNIEKRQVYMIARLGDLYELASESKQSLDNLHDELHWFREEARSFQEDNLLNERSAALTTRLQLPIEDLHRDASLLQNASRSDRRRLLSDSRFRPRLEAIYTFTRDDVYQRAFNGTGLRQENYNRFAAGNGQAIKQRIFNSVYENAGSDMNYSTIPLYYQVGLLPYLYKAATGRQCTVEIANPVALHDAVSALIEAFYLFPQEQAFPQVERRQWIDQLISRMQAMQSGFNQLADKPVVETMATVYLKAGHDFVYAAEETRPSLLSAVASLRPSAVLFTLTGMDPDDQQKLNNLSTHIQLRSTGSNFTNFKTLYPDPSFPFTGRVVWDRAPQVLGERNILRGNRRQPTGEWGYDTLADKTFIRDYITKVGETGSRSYDNETVRPVAATGDFMELFPLLGIATIEEKNKWKARYHEYIDNHFLALNTRIGDPIDARLKRMTLSKEIPVFGGLHLYFAEATSIGALLPGYRHENVGRERTRAILHGFKPRKTYSEYAFTPLFPVFTDKLSMHWKDQLVAQLRSNNALNELDKIPAFDNMTIFDFIEHLYNWYLDTRVKPAKTEKLAGQILAVQARSGTRSVAERFDYAGCSLFLTSRLNQTIASDAAVPFSTIHSGAAFRIEEVAALVRSIGYMHGKVPAPLLERLRGIKAAEAVAASTTGYDYTKSVFHYQEQVSAGRMETRVLDLDNFYDFILVMIRLLLVDTAAGSVGSVRALNPDDSEPYLAHAIYIAELYKKGMLG